MKLQSVDQLIQLEAHGGVAGQGLQLSQHASRPFAIGRRKGDALIQKQRLDAQLGSRQLGYLRVPQLHQMPQLPITRWRHVNAAQLPATQSFGEFLAIQAISLHFVARRARHHRRRHYQTIMARRRQLIVQSKPGRPGFVNKRHSLTRKVLSRIVEQLSRTIG